VERFRTLIPVTEVQVQGGKVADIDRHHWWELVHSRSDKEGRPERVYQFCNRYIFIVDHLHINQILNAILFFYLPGVLMNCLLNICKI